MRDSLALYYDCTVKDKNGKTVKKIRRRKCRSFVKQFLQLLFWEMSSASTSVTDTGNTARTLFYTVNTYPTNRWYFTAAAGAATNGVVVGSGTNAVDINDYTLQTLIAHGTGAGQLQYSAVTYGAPATDAAGTSFVVTRVFTNGSGGNVTVQEIGLYCNTDATYFANYFFCIARDLVSAPIVMANGESLTVNYTLLTAI